jgi:hypothetical protein
MARTAANLPEGTRITDYISLGVVAKTFPVDRIRRILAETGRTSKRQRDLPMHVVVYYVIAMALYMQVSCREVLRCLMEGIRWLAGPMTKIKVAGKSGISQARVRLGCAPVKQLHDEVVVPIAEKGGSKSTKGAWYGDWRLVSLDGSTLDVADTMENERAFGRPGAARGKTAFPQIRFVSLVENGTHVLFGSRLGGYEKGETTLCREVIPFLRKGMLCMGDRNFYGFKMWKEAKETGADLLWRVKKNLRLPCMKRFSDGSYQSEVYESEKDRRQDRNGITVRVIEYTIEDVIDAEPIYRLMTTIMDHGKAPARELAALYHERWEIETALDELKTHLRGSNTVLRSKRPDLVCQEFYGLLMAHFAARKLMHEAAMKVDEDPDRLSFVHAVRVIRRKAATFAAFSPYGDGNAE